MNYKKNLPNRKHRKNHPTSSQKAKMNTNSSIRIPPYFSASITNL